MPRTADTELFELIEGCETQSTVEIRPRAGSPFFFSTNVELNLDDDYIPRLLHIGGLNETGTPETNRVSVTLSNVELAWGIKLASEARELELADVVIRRFYRDAVNPLINRHKHFFTGKIAGVGADEREITFDVIRKSTAMGTSFAFRTLSPICPWIYKGNNCRDESEHLDCNQVRKSRNGCKGRANLEHDGSFAFPENPTQAAPGSGGNSGEGVGGGQCFSLDTNIKIPGGAVPIGEFPLGVPKTRIPIVSYDKLTGEIDFDDEIEEVFEYKVRGIYTLRFEHGTIEGVTPKHPFLTARGKFTRVENLSLQSATRTFAGKWFDSRLIGFYWNSEAETVVRTLRGKKNGTYFANDCAVKNKAPLEIVL